MSPYRQVLIYAASEGFFGAEVAAVAHDGASLTKHQP